jgi:CheY-like chemotaxis protein
MPSSSSPDIGCVARSETDTSAGWVLVVDDDEGVRAYFCDVLASAGYRVDLARDGGEAIEILRNRTPDVVLMDLVMPNREGIETIRELRALHPNLPVIAMSGALRNETYLKLAAVLGAGSTLAKPVTPEQLLSAVAAARP